MMVDNTRGGVRKEVGLVGIVIQKKISRDERLVNEGGCALLWKMDHRERLEVQSENSLLLKMRCTRWKEKAKKKNIEKKKN